MPAGCLFTIPFWISLKHIKKYRVTKLGRYILYDFAFCLIPAILSVLFLDIVSSVAIQDIASGGMTTILFSLIYTVIALIFWAMYLLFSRKK